MSFYLTYVTKEFHWVAQKDFHACGTFDTNHAPILH
jgi:hypothetical protein